MKTRDYIRGYKEGLRDAARSQSSRSRRKISNITENIDETDLEDFFHGNKDEYGYNAYWGHSTAGSNVKSGYFMNDVGDLYLFDEEATQTNASPQDILNFPVCLLDKNGEWEDFEYRELLEKDEIIAWLEG